MKLRLLLVLLGVLVWPAIAQARPAPVTWCGTDEVPGDRLPDVELAAQQIRFVYVVPADGADHFRDDASGIATDAAWIDQWWQSQDPARTPRFDRYPFPSCAPGFGQLDIGFHRLAFAADSVSTFESPAVELNTQLAGLYPSTQKTIVYYDGPTENSNLCGESYQAANDGGDYGIAFVYLQACDMGAPGTGFSADVAAHELTHDFGAVPAGAPHACPDTPSHVCDSTTDLMYPYANGSLDNVVLDVGHDDYYAEGGGLWNVQDSDWLEHLPQFPFALAVGSGGTVIARNGLADLPCTSGCTGLQLDDEAQVTLIAQPSPGFVFAGWSGGCSGSSSICTLSVGAATANTNASFVRAPLKVAVTVKGKGKVSAAGLACTSTCTKTFAGSSVRLTEKPTKGWKFRGWSGACTGTGPCTVSATGSVRAVFVRR